MNDKNYQRKVWSEEEDRALKELYESLKLNKWSHIAQQLEEQYGFIGRTGKQCRQRYNNHLDPSLSRDDWTFDQQMTLYHLHDDLGNKWAIISQRLNTGRTDNTIKNHFYSRLRKSLRRVNKIIQDNYKKEMREIQTKVLYKIIEASEEKFKREPMCDPKMSEYACKLKNKILLFSYDDQQLDNYRDEDSARDLIQEIIQFNRNYKRKPKRFRKIYSSYENIDDNFEVKKEEEEDGQKCEASAISFSSFSNKNRCSSQIKMEESDDDDIKPIVKMQTQKQKMISPIILTANLTREQKIEERVEKVRNSEQILQALGLLEDDLSMPHPIFMRKKTSFMSSQLSQEAPQFKFFDESEGEMKIMSTPILTAKRESIEEELFP